MKLVESMDITGVTELYAELCEFVHPAAASVLTIILEGEDGWRLYPNRQSEILAEFAPKSRVILGDVLIASFNAPLLTLRVLHKFGIFRHIEALRKYKFDDIASGSQIEVALRS